MCDHCDVLVWFINDTHSIVSKTISLCFYLSLFSTKALYFLAKKGWAGSTGSCFPPLFPAAAAGFGRPATAGPARGLPAQCRGAGDALTQGSPRTEFLRSGIPPICFEAGGCPCRFRSRETLVRESYGKPMRSATGMDQSTTIPQLHRSGPSAERRTRPKGILLGTPV